MATKTECDVVAHKPDGDHIHERVVVYREGPLFVWQAPDGWLAGHFETGLGIGDKKRWAKKRDALAYVSAILDYEENGKRINWSGLEKPKPGQNTDIIIEKFWEREDKEFLIRAHRHALKVASA